MHAQRSDVHYGSVGKRDGKRAWGTKGVGRRAVLSVVEREKDVNEKKNE